MSGVDGAAATALGRHLAGERRGVCNVGQQASIQCSLAKQISDETSSSTQGRSSLQPPTWKRGI